MEETKEDILIDVAVEFLHKYSEKMEFAIGMVGHETKLSYDDRQVEFMKGIKRNLERIETDEEWAKYVVGRVYRNKKKNLYEETIYWLLIDIYSIDGSTTRAGLYEKSLEDIRELRKKALDERESEEEAS